MSMGRLFPILGSLLFLTLTLVVGQDASMTANSKTDEPSLVNRERQWCDAFKDANEATLKEILSESFIFTDDGGQVSDQRQYIEATKNIRVKSYTLTDVAARVYGETGIVTGRWSGWLTIDGKDVKASFRFTDTFVKRNGKWYGVASQDTKLP